MEIKVGLQNVARELTIDTDQSAADVEAAFTKALADDSLFTLTDAKGGRTILRAERVAYLDLGTEHARRVGFGSV